MDVLFVFFEAGQVTKPSLFLPLSIQTTLRLASSSRTLAIGPFTRPGKVYSAVHFFPTAAQLSMCHIYPYTRYLKRKREGRGEREAILCEKQIRKKIANTWQPGIKLRFQAGFKANVFATFFFLDTKINFPYPFCYSFPLTLDFTFLLFNLFPANVPTQEHDFSHFLSYSSWKKRGSNTNIMVETYSLDVHSLEETFGFSVWHFFFSPSFKEDDQAIFFLVRKG